MGDAVDVCTALLPIRVVEDMVIRKKCMYTKCTRRGAFEVGHAIDRLGLYTTGWLCVDCFFAIMDYTRWMTW